MNYELAKELKDAGFPQMDIDELLNSPDKQRPYFPTLSELIEACGKPFMLHVREDGCQAFNDTHTFCGEDGSGTTPEEAVARLWLALNRPEKS